jgi:hypothetical protein
VSGPWDCASRCLRARACCRGRTAVAADVAGAVAVAVVGAAAPAESAMAMAAGRGCGCRASVRGGRACLRDSGSDSWAAGVPLGWWGARLPGSCWTGCPCACDGSRRRARSVRIRTTWTRTWATAELAEAAARRLSTGRRPDGDRPDRAMEL